MKCGLNLSTHLSRFFNEKIKMVLLPLIGSFLFIALAVSISWAGAQAGNKPTHDDDVSVLKTTTDAQVTARTTTTGIDAAMTETGSISGTVTDGMSPLSSIRVAVYRKREDDFISLYSIKTDASGNYIFTNLHANTYRISFSSDDNDYAKEYYDDAPFLESADDIIVTAGSVISGIDAVLVKPSSISGTVTDGTSPLEFIQVTAYRWTGSEFVRQPVSRRTNESGFYELIWLAAGTYRVKFWNHDFATEFYDDVPDLESAADIIVPEESSVSNINVVLVERGSINGTVTDGTNPLEGILVKTYMVYGPNFRRTAVNAYTDSLGNYSIRKLDHGIYRVDFHSNDYIDEFYDDAPDFDSATDISLTGGATISGIDAVLGEKGHITGTVTDGSAPLEFIRINVFKVLGDSFSFVGFTDTGISGKYDVGDLDTGTYRVRFDSGYSYSKFYDDKPDISRANDISVTEGLTTAGINAVMPAVVPAAPKIVNIKNSNHDGNFRVGWTSTHFSTSYQLEEKKDNEFWIQIYSGPNYDTLRSGLVPGDYCYRVRGSNNSASSSWSDQKCTEVWDPYFLPVVAGG